MRIAHHRHQFLDVNEADRIIEIFAAERKAGVTRFDGLFHIGLEIVLQVEVNDFAARRHDVAHDAVAQVEHVKDKLAPKRRNVCRFFALLENEPQFFLTVRKLARANRLQPEHSVAKENWKIYSEARSPV